LGLADFGTRILVEFPPLPAGARLFVPTEIVTSGNFGPGTPQGQLRLIQADKNGLSSPGFVLVPAKGEVGTTPVAEVSYSGSAAYAVYEVVYSDPAVLETAAIPVAVAFHTGTALGQVQASVSLAPINTINTSSLSAPIPRYAAISAAIPATSIDKCVAPVLSASVPTKSGPQNARVWNVQLNNGNRPAFEVEIATFTLKHTSGAKCSPVITSPTFPAALGDMPANSSVSTPVTIDFTGCSSTSKFKATLHVTANDGTAKKTETLANQAP
jgi:hypothetical protein